MLRERTRRFGWAIPLAFLVGIAILPPGKELAEAASAETAPAFTLRLLDGKVLSTKALRGQVVVLRFLASW